MELELQPVINSDTFSHATANSQEGAWFDIVMNVVVLNTTLLMFEFSISMFNLMLISFLWLTETMRTLRGEHITRGSNKLNMLLF